VISTDSSIWSTVGAWDAASTAALTTTP